MFRLDGQYNDAALAMDYFCPELKRGIALNALTGELLCDESLSKGRQTEKFGEFANKWQMVSDPIITKILCKTQNAIPQIATEGKPRSIRTSFEYVSKYLSAEAEDNPRINPFEKEWREPQDKGSPQYDPELFYESCGATYPTTIDPEENSAYIRGTSLGTLLSIVEGVLSETGYQCGIMPIFIGEPPGGQGKSTLIRKMAIVDDYYANWGDYPKDRKAMYYASYNKVVIELDEGGGAWNTNKLKSDISTPFLTTDIKYRGTLNLQKKFIYIMSTNNFIPVKENNRRFHPIKFENPDKKFIFGDALTPDRMRGLYWIVKREYYDRGVRAQDILDGIEKLAAAARGITSSEPITVDYVKDYLENEDYTSDTLVKTYLNSISELSFKDVESGMNWWKQGGYISMGFEKLMKPHKTRSIDGTQHKYTYRRKI